MIRSGASAHIVETKEDHLMEGKEVPSRNGEFSLKMGSKGKSFFNSRDGSHM